MTVKLQQIRLIRPENILLLLITAIFLISGSSCREDFLWGTRVGDLTYSGEVKLLGEQEMSLLSEVTDNGMVFSGSNAELAELNNQSIIVAGVSEITPSGLIRRVTGIRTEESSLILETAEATLTDVVKEGVITLKLKLLERNFSLRSRMDGVLVTGSGKAFEGLAVTLDNFELFRDGTRRAAVNGAIGIGPEIDLTIHISSSRITEIRTVTTLNKVDEITVSSNGAFSGGRRHVAAEFVHAPITVDGLVFTPEVRIICGFSGIVSGAVTSGVRQDRVITSELHYDNSEWSAIPPVASGVFDFSAPSISENSDLKVYSGPEITINLFGKPLEIVEATGYYLLEARKSASPMWRLLIGSEGHNSMESLFLGLDEDYSSEIEIAEEEIANADDVK